MSEINPVLKKINTLLYKRNWTVYRLSKESDIAYSSLNSMFLKNTQPTLPTLEKICAGLQISLSDFFLDDETEYDKTLFSSEEKELMELYRNMPQEEKNRFLAYAKGFAKKPL